TGTATIITGATLNLNAINGFIAAAADSFTFLDNDASDPITGTFTGPTLKNFLGSGFTAAKIYNGGAGNNDLVITNALPAPISLLRAALGSPMLNRATGLMEYIVRVTNDSGTTIEGVRLTVTNLIPVYQLWNRTHPTLPIIEVRQSIAPMGTLDIKVAIYSTSRSLSTWVPAVTALPLVGMTIDPATCTVPSAGCSYDVVVTCAGVWSVTESLAWASVSKIDGSSNDNVTVTLQPNTALTARTGVINIGSKVHTVTQAGVVRPVIGSMSASYLAIVSGAFNLPTPTNNLPATWSATGLPSGLKIDSATGLICGKPTVAGTFNVKVQASNAAGVSLPRTFSIVVAPLPVNVVGDFHGYVDSDDIYRFSPFPYVGSRMEITVTPTGAVSGFLLEGATRKALVGVLDSMVGNPLEPTCCMLVPGSTLVLALNFDGATNEVTGFLRQPADPPTAGAPARGWRKIWRITAPVNRATVFKALHNAALKVHRSPLQFGSGFASLSITADTGEVTLTGRLPDGAAFTGTTFVGPNGQVLLYQPLFNNRGSCFGKLDITPGANAPVNNTVTGALSWWKPPPLPNTTDTLYAAGFDLALVADGGTYTPPGPGQRVLGLSSGAGNSVLAFSGGALDLESLSFFQALTIANPGVNGLTNTAVVLAPIANKVTITSFSAATGLFQGTFTITGPGTLSRTTSYFGQICNTSGGARGFGHFILPQVPVPPQNVNTAPKLSGEVSLDPSR
ncbi:MAG: putative Ig domain-containing protein, partial [Roseimicrobium sp.]